MGKITTQGRITILLGQRQVDTGERWSLRHLAQVAEVPKDMVYRIDAGEARYIDLRALARLCDTLQCHSGDILVWGDGDNGYGDESL